MIGIIKTICINIINIILIGHVDFFVDLCRRNKCVHDDEHHLDKGGPG